MRESYPCTCVMYVGYIRVVHSFFRLWFRYLLLFIYVFPTCNSIINKSVVCSKLPIPNFWRVFCFGAKRQKYGDARPCTSTRKLAFPATLAWVSQCGAFLAGNHCTTLVSGVFDIAISYGTINLRQFCQFEDSRFWKLNLINHCDLDNFQISD